MTSVPIERVPAPTTLPNPPAPPGERKRAWRLTRGSNPADRLYRAALTGLALALPLLLVALVVELAVSAWPAIKRFGPAFLWTSVWDPVAGIFGAAPMMFGTLASSLIALLLAVPLALGTAIFLTEFAPRWIRQPVAFLVELLAAIPSVVYGLWGIFVLIPFLRSQVVPPLKAVLGWTPLFQGVFYGNSLLAGGIILAIMIIPYIAALARRHGLQHLARHRGDVGDDHDGEDDPACKQRVAVEHALEQRRPAEHRLERRHDLAPEEGDQHEDPPQAVHHARDRGEQLHEERDRLAYPARGELGEENRGAQGQRHGEEQRDQRRREGPKDHRRRAEHPRYWIPDGCPQERRPVPLDRVPRVHRQLHDERHV